jgi:hypothetical protein
VSGGHPRFETEVRPAMVQKIHAVIQEAVQAQD